jgi:2,4-diketo-3-deoxy-L-fuconate hydrolase
MRLLRFGANGEEKPGLLDDEGAIRDLSGTIVDLTPDLLDYASLARLETIDPASLPRVEGSPRIGVPVASSRKFIAIGLNYRDHAIESNLPIPAEPIIFTKAISCLQGPNDPVRKPR